MRFGRSGSMLWLSGLRQRLATNEKRREWPDFSVPHDFSGRQAVRRSTVIMSDNEPPFGRSYFFSRRGIAFWLLTPFTVPLIAYILAVLIGLPIALLAKPFPESVQLLLSRLVGVIALGLAVGGWLYLWRLFKRHQLEPTQPQ